jgi:predicted alpha/beta superfamily hydrolase
MRVLSGYSLGGLFGLYTLFHDPKLFNKYLIGSPSIQYGEGITFKYEINHANSTSDLMADIFMSSGEQEEIGTENVKKLTETLLSRSYENLNITTVTFENEDHVTCFPAAISRGLTELFAIE